MKTKIILSTAILALAGIANSTSAQTAAFNDLIFGFRATGGTGSGVNLEVNLGSVGSFVTQTAGTTVTLGNLSLTDLTANYGASWNTRSDLFFGAIGSTNSIPGNLGPNNQANKTIWLTSAAGTSPFTAPAWNRQASASQANAISNIGALYNGFNGSSSNYTVGANSSSLVFETSQAFSWSTNEAYSSGTVFQIFNPNSQFEQSTNTSGGSVYADLYQVTPSAGGAAGTLLGSFALSSAGVLSFTAGTSAIPEPSTYAAIFGAAAMGVALLRRRRQAKAVATQQV